MKRLIPHRLRSFCIWHLAGLMNWNFEHIIAPAPDFSRRFEFGWWLDLKLSDLFTWFYEGSDEELRDALDTPEDYRSPRHRYYVAEFADLIS